MKNNKFLCSLLEKKNQINFLLNSNEPPTLLTISFYSRCVSDYLKLLNFCLKSKILDESELTVEIKFIKSIEDKNYFYKEKISSCSKTAVAARKLSSYVRSKHE